MSRLLLLLAGLAPALAGLCERAADVVFVIDGSQSVGGSNFNNKVRPFVASVASNFDLKPNGVAMGALQFAAASMAFSAMVKIPLSPVLNTTAFVSAANAMTYINVQGTATHVGINTGVTMINTQGRKSVGGESGDVIIVITDGKSGDRSATIAAANEARKAGVTVLAVTIGTGFDKIEIDGIAGGDKNLIFNVESFASLGGVFVTRLSDVICNTPIRRTDLSPISPVTNECSEFTPVSYTSTFNTSVPVTISTSASGFGMTSLRLCATWSTSLPLWTNMTSITTPITCKQQTVAATSGLRTASVSFTSFPPINRANGAPLGFTLYTSTFVFGSGTSCYGNLTLTATPCFYREATITSAGAITGPVVTRGNVSSPNTVCPNCADGFSSYTAGTTGLVCIADGTCPVLTTFVSESAAAVTGTTANGNEITCCIPVPVSPSPSPTTSVSPSPTRSSSISRSVSPSPTASKSVPPTGTPTPSVSCTTGLSMTPSSSVAASPSTSPSVSESISASETASETPSPSETSSESASPSETVSPSNDPTSSVSPSNDPTSSVSPSSDPTSSTSPSVSPSVTASASSSAAAAVVGAGGGGVAGAGEFGAALGGNGIDAGNATLGAGTAGGAEPTGLDNPKTRSIVFGSIGGLLFLLAIIACWLFLCCYLPRKKKREREAQEARKRMQQRKSFAAAANSLKKKGGHASFNPVLAVAPADRNRRASRAAPRLSMALQAMNKPPAVTPARRASQFGHQGQGGGGRTSVAFRPSMSFATNPAFFADAIGLDEDDNNINGAPQEEEQNDEQVTDNPLQEEPDTPSRHQRPSMAHPAASRLSMYNARPRVSVVVARKSMAPGRGNPLFGLTEDDEQETETAPKREDDDAVGVQDDDDADDDAMDDEEDLAAALKRKPAKATASWKRTHDTKNKHGSPNAVAPPSETRKLIIAQGAIVQEQTVTQRVVLRRVSKVRGDKELTALRQKAAARPSVAAVFFNPQMAAASGGGAPGVSASRPGVNSAREALGVYQPYSFSSVVAKQKVRVPTKRLIDMSSATVTSPSRVGGRVPGSYDEDEEDEEEGEQEESHY